MSGGMFFIEWISVDERLPDTKRQVLVTGDSGYMPPSHRFVRTAKYYPEYRPLAPWQSDSNDALEDDGHRPTHWAEIPEGFFP